MDEFEKNYNRVLRFLSFRVRSEKEIEDYLQKKKVEKSLVKKIIAKLKQYRFLNDEEFARIWIEQRTKLKPRAWRIIQFELKRKGISEEIIQGSKIKVQSDLESAKILIQRKWLRYKNMPKEELRQKLARFLAGKGFNWDTIKKALELTVDDKK